MFRARMFSTLTIGFVLSWAAMPAELRADTFDEYSLTGSFELPQPSCVFDVLSDGRVIVLYLADVYVEDAVGAGTFTLHGTLPDADMPSPSDGWGAAFIRVSPDGTKIAAGNNGGGYPWNSFEVGILDFPALSGNWFPVNHYDAKWFDDTHLAISAQSPGPTSIVTVLDTTSSPEAPTNPTVIENIGGASGGVTFDSAGNLYTGNGYQYDGPSGTGWIKVFDNDAWIPALSGASALDFEATGTLVVDILSATSLGFDLEENLHVGGADYSAEPQELDYAALVRASAISDAIAGQGPANPDDPTEVRRFDPDWDSTGNQYVLNYNPATRELYMVDFWDTTVYVYTAPVEPIPTVSQWGLVVMTLLLLTLGTLIYARSAPPSAVYSSMGALEHGPLLLP